MADKTITAFKGFDKDWRCRGFNYGEPKGQTFITDKPISLCNFGFHACEHPLDIWRYYPPIDDNKAARVELSGVTAENEPGDTKRVGNSVTVKAALSIADLVSASIEWVSSRVKDKPDDAARIGSSGYDARIGSSGHAARIGSSGYDARIGSSGNDARIGSSGNDARIGSSGNDARIGSSGNDARIGSSGYAARIGSSGYDARIGSSGNDARIGSSGNDARIGSSGHAARIGSSGNDARIGSSGNDARIGSSGYAARIGSSGNDARIGSSGYAARIACAGYKSRVKAGPNSCFCLTYWDGKRPRMVVGYVGENGIEADTWYRADDNGNLVPA